MYNRFPLRWVSKDNISILDVVWTMSLLCETKVETHLFLASNKTFANSVDPDLMPHRAASDRNLHFLNEL